MASINPSWNAPRHNGVKEIVSGKLIKPKNEMEKKLENLTKQEWDTLFPVELVSHNPMWKNIYEKEERKIIEKLGSETIIRIEHFGSTSIPGIRAKPYIDIIIEIPKDRLFDEEIINGLF
ncbi:GrpB family protein [Indibacter alkaliphilus]|nr:GrpB family protein [Indibacter alkaliphilus]